MITIVKSPAQYSPAGNPIIFQVTSNDINILYFNVQLINVPSGDTISNLKYYVRPDFTNGVSFNLSDILSNLVETKINSSSQVLAAPIPQATVSYRLVITERINQNGTVVNGATYSNTNDKFTVWNGEFSRLLMSAYVQDKWVANSTTPAKFLSLKEQISKQSGTSTEQLYFINRDNLAKQCRIRTYDVSGNQNHLYVASIPSGDMVRFNVAPKVIYNLYNTDFSTVGHYRVDLLDANSNVVSEEKVYKYVGYKCTLQPVNILFTNSLGGLESFTFFNPIQTTSVSKTMLKQNVLQMNNGIYSDNKDGVLNQSDRIINVNSTSTFKVFSDVLTDHETIMLMELIISKNVYVELSDNKTLVPITITNNNYQVLLRKTNGFKLNRLELNYTAQSGFIPSKSELFGSGTGSAQIQFQDMPLPPDGNEGVGIMMQNRTIPITYNLQKVFTLNDVPAGDAVLTVNGNILMRSNTPTFNDMGDWYGEVINGSFKITLNADVYVEDIMSIVYVKQV